MFKDKSLIAMDIGSRCIKVIQGKPYRNGIQVTGYGICETPRGSYHGGSIIDKLNILKSMEGLISSKNMRSKNVIMGIKGQDVIIRHILMPVMSEKQVKNAAMLEIQQYLPMDPNEYVIDSKIINKTDTKEKKALNVLLVAAPKRKISDYYYLADKLGLRVKAVDLFANSVSRFFQNHDIYGGKCVSLLDIGYESSTLTLIEDGKLFLEREIAIGMNNIDNMLKKTFAAETSEVDTIRQRVLSFSISENTSSKEDPRIYYANNSAREILDKLLDDAMKIFDFYVSSGFNKTIDRLFIHGGGSKLEGIVEYIKNFTGTNTVTFQPSLLANIYNMDDDLVRNVDLYINCISLLLRKE